jgi:hypothetical protein
MKRGDLTLNSRLRDSKWMALAVAFFLLFANCDNIPDCPELLRLHSGPVVSVSLVHPAITTGLDAVSVAWKALRPPAIHTQSVSDIILAVLPLGVPQLLYQAADPSPPLAETQSFASC